MLKGFKDFLLRGNVIDLAVAVVIGAAFTAVVSSFTESFLQPLIGLVGGGGVGYLLVQYINLLQWNQAATLLWMIAIVVMVMDYSSAAIRGRII